MSRVARLPKDPGPAGWNALLGDPGPACLLEKRITADWLVIGGGFAGLSAARRLTQLRGGDRIVLLEASRIGQGPAGRNSGFMIDLPHDLASEDYGGTQERDFLQIEQNRTAIAFAREAAEEYDLPVEAFDSCGKINGAATESGLKHNQDFARHLQVMGEDSQLLDANQMYEVTGTDFYRGGLFTPGTVMLQPALYVRGLAAGLSDRIALYENSPVVSLDRIGDSWSAITPHGQVTAPKVILAVNGHAESFGHFKGRLMHVFTYASMTAPLSRDQIRILGGNAKWGITPADPMGTTVRRISGTGGDRLVIRNRFTFDPSMEISQTRLDRIAQDHDKSFKRRFPMLGDVAMDYRWGGRLCLSRNGVSAFGEVDQDLFSACCQNGLGTTKGTLSGLCAAELACQANSTMGDSLLAEEAPQKLPPGPIAQLGATAVLKWKEFRAGVEL